MLECMPQLLIIESELAIWFHFLLCSTRYTVLQAKNNVRSTSAINPATTESGTIIMIETMAHDCKSTPSYVVAEKEVGYKGRQMMFAF